MAGKIVKITDTQATVSFSTETYASRALKKSEDFKISDNIIQAEMLSVAETDTDNIEGTSKATQGASAAADDSEIELS